MSKLFSSRSYIYLFLLLIPFMLQLPGPVVAGETAVFDYLVWGDLTAEGERETTLKRKNNQLGLYNPPEEMDIAYFHSQAFNYGNDGAACFPGGTQPGKYKGGLVINQKQDGTARADFFFVASDKYGNTGTKYRLELFGTLNHPDNFPPSLNSTVTMSAPAWIMSTEGKGKNRKNTCTGDGFLDFNFDITRID